VAGKTGPATAHCDGESNRSAALGMTSFILRERVEGDSLFSLMATRALSVLAETLIPFRDTLQQVREKLQFFRDK
jgi:hypothetical protein